MSAHTKPAQKSQSEKRVQAYTALEALIRDWRKRARTLRRRGLLASAQAYEDQAMELEQTLVKLSPRGDVESER